MQENHAPTPVATAQSQESDLIDFGQNDDSAIQQPPVPADLHAAQTQNHGQQQKALEQTLQATATQTYPDKNVGSLIDYHDDLKKELPVVNKLKRQDTDTHSLDEFVDAEG